MKGTSGIASLGVLALLVVLETSGHAADAWLYKITKGIHYGQLPGGSPTVHAENGYVFQANVFMTAPGRVSGATVVSPEGTVRTLAPDGNDELEFRNRVNSKATLEARYPDGNFTYTINAVNDGQRVIRLPMLGNVYPPGPFVHNLVALQAVNAHGHLVVRWDPFPGGRAWDYIQLRIEDSSGNLAWESRDYGEPGALDGTATYTIVKPAMLKPGTTYQATLLFEKSCSRDNASYPGAFGWSTYHARTEFPIKTSAAAAANVASYELAKGRSFEQTNAAPPVPEPGDEFIFSAEVRASAPNLVASAGVTSPAGTAVVLLPDSDREQFEFSESSANQNALEAKYPAGNYIVQMQTASQGNRSVGLWFSAGQHPPAPRVHFNPAQTIAAEPELRVAWDAWAGATGDDFIQLRIEDDDGNTVFETPDFDDKDALDGRATSALVPAGTFARGQDYEARLTFRRFARLDTTSYAGAIGIASYFTRTKFEIRTVRPDLQQYTIEKGRAFEQTSPTSPLTPDLGDEFTFSAEAEASTTGSIQSATLTTPLGATVTLTPDAAREEFDFDDAAATETSFEAEYPAGAYRFNIQGLQGSASVVLNVPSAGFPPVPRAHFDSSQKVRPDQALSISWNAWPGGTATDFVQFRIDDKSNDRTVFETAAAGEAGALNGQATSVTVPAGTFQIGKEYEARLVFRRVAVRDEDTLPGAEGIVRFFSRTKFDIEAIPPDAQEYSIETGREFVQTTHTVPPTPEVGSRFTFSAQVEASAAGRIQSATLTTPPGATVTLTGDASGEEFDFEDTTGTITNFTAKYPPGAYRFNVQGTLGSASVVLNVPAAAFPPFPRARFDSDQRVRPDQALTISWDGWVGSTANDFIRLRIQEEGSRETVFETPNFGDAGALNGAATSVVLPAGLFEAGKEYEARLTFRTFLLQDENVQPGADGVVSIFTRTDFDIDAVPPDVKRYHVSKERLFVQTNASGLLATGFVFRAEIEAETAQSVATAAILTPTGRALTLVQQRSGDEFRFVDARNSQAALDADYPEGNYILAINTVNDGGKNIAIALTNAAYPNAPRLGNYDAAGRINANAEFVLSWDAFAGGTARDFIEVKIEEMDGDEILDTENYGKTGALNGRDAGVSLPAFLLQSGRSYMAEIYFEKVTRASDAGYPGADGRVGYASTTFVPIASAGPGNPPLLQSYRVQTDRRIQFYLTTLDGGTYQIQGSPDMVNWTTVGTVSATANLSVFTAPPPPAGLAYFYRAILVR